jgi:hypothetical protein
MKGIITLLTLIFTATIGFAQTDSIQGNQYELKGKIINEIALTPHCGTIAWGTVIEFEIIEFSKSDYTLDAIGVIFTCPEFQGDGFFEVGKIYTLTVLDENQAGFSWSIPNESLLEKYDLDKKLWAIGVEKEE